MVIWIELGGFSGVRPVVNARALCILKLLVYMNANEAIFQIYQKKFMGCS